MPERFVIREMEGFLSITAGTRSSAPLGLSCHVLDTAFNYRCVASFRTEDYGGSTEQKRGHVRRMAEKQRLRLEAAYSC